MAVSKRIHFLEPKVFGTTVRYYCIFWVDVPVSQRPIYANPAYTSQLTTSGSELALIRTGEVLEVYRDFLVTPGMTDVAIGAIADAAWAAVQQEITQSIRPVVDRLAWRGASAVWSSTPSQPSVDTTAPTVSNRDVVNILPDRVTFTFTTDEPAAAQIHYGITTSGESLFPASPAPSTPNLITSHSITVTGLASSTTYKYKVFAVDAAANSSLSSELTFPTAVVATGGAVLPQDTVDTSVPAITGTDHVVTTTGELVTALAA